MYETSENLCGKVTFKLMRTWQSCKLSIIWTKENVRLSCVIDKKRNGSCILLLAFILTVFITLLYSVCLHSRFVESVGFYDITFFVSDSGDNK